MEKVFETQQVLALFLLFFVPGFISLKTYDLLVPGERRDFSKSLYDAVAYSALNFAFLFWVFDFILSASLPRFWWYLCWVVVLIVFPVLWPVVALWLRKHPWIAGHLHNPNPRVWDCVFQRGESYWVIVHLKDERRIGGWFHTRSFASSSPASPEIYLEEVWHLDEQGRFISQVESTAGILIFGDEMIAVEFFKGVAEADPEAQPDSEPAPLHPPAETPGMIKP